MESSINLVAFGHSHFVENEQISKEGKNFHRLNNGFFPASNSFIYITELEQKLISLSSKDLIRYLTEPFHVLSVEGDLVQKFQFRKQFVLYLQIFDESF